MSGEYDATTECGPAGRPAVVITAWLLETEAPPMYAFSTVRFTDPAAGGPVAGFEVRMAVKVTAVPTWGVGFDDASVIEVPIGVTFSVIEGLIEIALFASPEYFAAIWIVPAGITRVAWA